jgi:hypothetical protein
MASTFPFPFRKPKTAIGRIVVYTALTLMCCASPFYLFVVPAMVAASHEPLPTTALMFGTFMYFQLWLLSMAYAYEGLAGIYRFKRATFFPVLGRTPSDLRAGPSRPASAIVATMISYFVAVYGFALLYVAISNRDHASFSLGEMSVGTAFYFSLITASTVGYGDIAPVSSLARWATVAEVVVALLYAIFLFSVIASAVREGGAVASRPFRSRLLRRTRTTRSAVRQQR